MDVGSEQLRNVFRLAKQFDRDPRHFRLGRFGEDLSGVLDDFHNIAGHESRLKAVDDELCGVLGSVVFDPPGLAALLAHFMAIAFENYANQGRGYRRFYEQTQELRRTAVLDGPFVLQELVPSLLELAPPRRAFRAQLKMLDVLADFMDRLDPEGQWSDDHPLAQAMNAAAPELLLQLHRRGLSRPTSRNLIEIPHTLEQRLGSDFFKGRAKREPTLQPFFREYGYVPHVTLRQLVHRFAQQARRLLMDVFAPDPVLWRMRHWRGAWRRQWLYMGLMVLVLAGVLWAWSEHQNKRLEELNGYCRVAAQRAIAE
ncbi:hypothetical protein ACFL6M_04130 [Candidatus Eisenbacteria bacterium]|uniref:Uncharacterized protein n=1 Tax=Eiseniibacteriota bacterium TaxID=2212470 RepID=A0ABV6YKA9_UNCEI